MKEILKKLKLIFVVALLCGVVFLITKYYYSKQDVETVEVEVVREVETEKIIEKKLNFLVRQLETIWKILGNCVLQNIAIHM